jgi:OOP family OmpA-OmpF porin
MAFTKNLAVIGSMLTLTTATAAFATNSQSTVGTRYVSPFVTYSIADDDRTSDDSVRGGVMFGKVLSERLNLELGVISQEFDAEPGGQSFEEVGVKLDALWFISRGEKFSPYISTGIGAIETSNTVSNATSVDPAVDLGLGFLYGAKNSVAMRADVRHRVLGIDENVSGSNQSTFNDWQVNLGLVAPLGVSPKVAAAPQAKPMIKPAAMDSDKDGVADASDLCPNSAANAVVDSQGCATFNAVVIYFASDSSALRDNANTALDNVATDVLNKSVAIETAVGHADSSGNALANQKLSEDRVNAVIVYLANKGVNTTRVSTSAKGQSMPAEDNRTVAGRAKNRRVELKLHK